MSDRRLYRETHATFEAYCGERWGWTRKHAYRQMDAAAVADAVCPMGHTPASEREARAMLDLCGDPPRTRRHVGVRLSLTLTTSKCPRAAETAGGVATAYWEAIAVNESANRSPDEAEASEAEAYERFVKPGDAVETPDGGLWVVNDVAGDDLAVVSAHRDALGTVYADVYDAVATRLPIKFTTKVVDARAVHRE